MQRLPPQQSRHHREQKLLHGLSRPFLPDSSPPLTAGSLLTSVLGSFSPSFSFLSSQRIPVLQKDCSQCFQSCSEVNVHTSEPHSADVRLPGLSLTSPTDKLQAGLESAPVITDHTRKKRPLLSTALVIISVITC